MPFELGELFAGEDVPERDRLRVQIAGDDASIRRNGKARPNEIPRLALEFADGLASGQLDDACGSLIVGAASEQAAAGRHGSERFLDVRATSQQLAGFAFVKSPADSRRNTDPATIGGTDERGEPTLGRKLGNLL